VGIKVKSHGILIISQQIRGAAFTFIAACEKAEAWRRLVRNGFCWLFQA
jgi:hypothetical protein